MLIHKKEQQPLFTASQGDLSLPLLNSIDPQTLQQVCGLFN
jgi:hypothetical protein